jgi:ABC-type transport system substrate-binding protein
MKLPKKSQWRQFFNVLTKKEKISFFIFFFIFIVSSSFLLIDFYLKNTKIVPAEGGEYIEGMVVVPPISPKDINPIYAPSSDIGRDLTELIFAGLLKYDSEGKLLPDLAKEYKILEEGKVYEFYLKENLFWQDGVPLTADDIIFTVDTIQNPDITSPLRPMWLGIEVEKISDLAVRFKLKNESAIFLENCTLKIIPKHVWENIPPQNFSLTTANLNPIGSGLYKLKNLFQDKEGKIISLDLIENPLYFGQKPYIPKISFRFFDSEEKLLEAWTKGEIKGFSPTSLTSFTNLTNSTNLYSFTLPRYFAVFFNLKNSRVLSEKEVRVALNYGTNKNEILNKVLSNFGKIVSSPILPDIYDFKEPSKIYQFDIEKAKEILEKAGFKDEDGDGLREKTIKKELAFQFKSNLSLGSKGKEVEELQKCLAKDKEIYPEGEITGYFGQKTKEAVILFQEKYKDDILKPYDLEKGTGEVRGKTQEKLNEICFEKPEEKIPLKFSLATVDQPVLVEVATILKNQWKELGAAVDIKTFTSSERDIILRKRQFETLLFGEILELIPDPFPFWHSSQKGELGLNLSNYENKKVDELLETARKSLDELERKKNLEEFQELIIEDAPAIFLYNPDYHYLVSKEIKGIKEGVLTDPSKRFSGISNWYIKEKRALK